METTTTTSTGDRSGATSAGSSPRVEQFKSDVSDMKLKGGNAGREKALGTVGVVLMLVGIIGSFFSYVSATNLADQRDILEQVIMAIAFVTVSLLGAALFVRYAFANFLRMWLLRNLYEGQANTDRLIEAIAEKR